MKKHAKRSLSFAAGLSVLSLLFVFADARRISRAAGLPDAEWQNAAYGLILGGGWRDQAEDFSSPAEGTDYAPIAFGLYDFNLDGIYEIIANNGEESYAENVDYVYLCGGEGVTFAGVLGGSELYAYDQTTGYPGIFAQGAHTGVYWTDYVSLESGQVERSRVVSYEDISNPGVITEDAGLFAAWEKVDNGGAPLHTLELTALYEIEKMGWEAFLSRYGLTESEGEGTGTEEHAEAAETPESWYQLMVEDVTFEEAFERAKAAGGALALPGCREDFDRLISQIQEENLSDRIFFLGGRRAMDSTLYHDLNEDGSPGDKILNDPSFWGNDLWMEGEPSFQDGEIEETCLVLYQRDGSFVLNDVPMDILKVVPGWSGRIGYVVEHRPSGEETGGILPPESVLASVPETFYFSSGVGAWSTDLKLYDDGSFSGQYHDANMGEDTEHYPGGTVYECVFSGAFTDFRKVDDYTYSCALRSLTYAAPPGQDYEEDGVHHIASEAYGLYGGEKFMIYLPGHPISTLPEVFLSWAWMYMGYPDDSVKSLTVCGLYNVADGSSFGGFSA